MSAISTITGTLKVTGQQDLAAIVLAASSILGNLSEAADEPVSALLSATSSVTANMTEVHSLSGSVSGSATLTGGLTEKDSLIGTVSGTSTLTGALSLKKSLAHAIPWLSGYDYVADPYCVALYNAETWDTYLDDQSGEGNHLQCTPQVNTSDKQEGDGCADFDNAVRPSGIDYADADLAAGWPGKVGTGSQTMSVAFWFKAHDAPAVNYFYTLAGKGRDTTTGWGVYLYNNKIYLSINGNLITGWRGTTGTFATNIWYHVGVTYNNADLSYRIRVYDTYTSSNWADKTGTMPNPMVLNNADFSIAYGMIRSTSALVYQYDGLLDDLAVFKDVLSAGEIDNCRTGAHDYAADGNCVAHWGFNSANFPREDKGNLAVHEISVPKLDTTVYRMGAASMEFQQTNYGGAYIVDTATSANFPYKAGTANLEWSTAFWVRFRTLGSAQYLVSKYITNVQGSVAVFLSGGAHGHITLRVRYAASSTEDYTHTMEIGPLVWYHVVVAVSAAANTYLINVWDDNLEVETTVSGALLHDPIVSTEPWKLGSQQLQDSSLALDGWLDEVAIFNVAITPATIADIRLETQADILSTVTGKINETHSLSASVSAVSTVSCTNMGTESHEVFAQTETILTYPPPVPMPWNYNEEKVASGQQVQGQLDDLVNWGEQLGKYTEEELIKIHRNLYGITTSVGTVVSVTLTPSRLVGTRPDGTLVSTNLSDWIAGTANRVTVADDGDGSVTLSGPQDTHTGASPTFVSVVGSSLTADKPVYANAGKTLASITVGTGLTFSAPTLSLSMLGIEALTDPGADRIVFWDETDNALKWLSMGDSVAITATTLDTIQDIRTTATPTFAGMTITGMKSGATQAAAGAAANELWRTSGHATLPDNIVMIGE